jgi:prepilin-type N-terminal cleavage/methylation domain-containing protein
MKNRHTPQSGFTLIEMSIVILIMGLIVGAVFSFLSVQRISHNEDITKQREQKIANALAYYAQMHSFLPCPSLPNPNLVSPGLSPGDPITTCTTPQDRMGVVPFRILGMTQEDATDGWGNAISYGVATNAHKPLTNLIEAACRTTAWFNGTTNANPAKAAFCCQQDNSMQVFFSGGKPVITTYYDPSNHNTDYKPVNTQATVGATPAGSIAYYAYILISHGQNGYGARRFCDDPSLPSCTNNRGATQPLQAQYVDELKNAMVSIYANDTDYVVGPRAANFDDIVLWRTQDRVISELNNDSCALP